MPSIGIADKTTLDAVSTKVGVNTDVAGTSTLFARLAQIAAYVDTLETLIGTASPTSGDLTTLFKGLKLIADYVDTLETKLGLNTDTAGTGTVFARLAQIAGYTDAVESLIGNANPTAAGTDQVFKYLKKIFDATSGGGTAQLTRIKSTTAGTFTALDVTGSGVINSISLPYIGQGVTVEVTVTLDGVAKSVTMLENLGQSTQIGAPVLVGPFKFNTSCTITFNINASVSVEILIAYRTGV
ncbi:MAG TPA: hypothetical protein PK728_04540 [Bacillota bacterium]|nr:hypothetical protein [Bacillota bacterium]